ncbi:hypothetical protein IF655_11320 [Streptomyces sp. DSM 110735]|uniref:hypothetical protein n=1 Tax=Streptomyces sp. DSM 110735 TaxID=2775031 RepID=UPI0018F58E92|nr:hypothetical protein [Streptomyces sp. DSM 110735]MBJ7903888.1 hypothetical protein [Streptomyces sp. DSM 110735]
MYDATQPSVNGPGDDDFDALFAEDAADYDLDGAHSDLASTFPPAAGPSLAHGYAWRCRGTDTSGCDQAHSGTVDGTDTDIEECPRHHLKLEYRLP